MNHKTYLKEIKKIKDKIDKAIQTKSYKHYAIFKKEYLDFKKKNQASALKSYVDELKASGKVPQDYSLTSIF